MIEHLSDLNCIGRILPQIRVAQSIGVRMDGIKLSKVLQRELKGKVLADVAKEAGISKSLLHDWAVAGRLPAGKNIPQLRKLAKYLALTLEELLFEDSGETKIVLASTTFTDHQSQYRVNIEKLTYKGKK